jgi:hypothetical protein
MDAWDKKADLIEEIVSSFANKMGGITDEFYSLIVKSIDDTFSFTKGAFNQGDFFANLAEFNAKVEANLSRLGYGNFVRDLLEEVQGADKYTIETFRKLNKLDVSSFLKDNPSKKFAIESVEYNLRDNAVRRELLQPITDILITNASSGLSQVEAKEFIQDYLFREGKNEFQQWADVTATDVLNQYNGKINQALKVEYDLNGWAYVGSIIKTSRAFCRDCVAIGDVDEKTMEDKINEYSNNGLLYGMATTIENVTVNRGGFNCRHEAIPINI